MKYITLVEKIGHGGQAEVFKAKYGLDDVVIKMFLNPDDKDWRREIEFAKQVRYRHIVQFYHLKHDMFMMEFVEGGSLSNAILMGSTEDWETKIRIAKQVSLGLTYLHGQNILHCDIKSANILLTKNLDAKICDFGRARMVGQSGRDGTLPWMAPELFLEPPQYSCKSDVYALGMVMWEMASGCTQPYQEHLPESMVHCIVNGITEDIPSRAPEEYTACIQACWHQRPEERPAATEIFPDIDEISQDHDIDDLQALGDELDKNIQSPEAFERNDESEYSTLGGIYYDGLGVRKNYKKSMEWYLKASNAGDSNAMVHIGEMYRDGHGVEQDYTKAMEWYLKACDAGDSNAMVNIGEMYRNGHGVEQDYITAMEWHLKASDAGELTSMFNIGVMYHNGEGVQQDYAKAMEWWLKASDAGYSNAMVNIGEMYRNGRGVEQDYTKAMEWYLKASDAGDSDAKVNIGEMYHNGQGVQQDYAKAMEWYLKASNAGDSSAKVNIGEMYRNGYGVEQDYTNAMQWHLNASDVGHSTSMFNIGEMYYKGQGVGQDYTKAMKWYLKASHAGDPQAKFCIGHMYREGQGVEKDCYKAMAWFLEALHAGVAEAILEIDRMFSES